ncbi:HECT domain-containing family protein, partial [Cryptosporidium serpentis]
RLQNSPKYTEPIDSLKYNFGSFLPLTNKYFNCGNIYKSDEIESNYQHEETLIKMWILRLVKYNDQNILKMKNFKSGLSYIYSNVLINIADNKSEELSNPVETLIMSDGIYHLACTLPLYLHVNNIYNNDDNTLCNINNIKNKNNFIEIYLKISELNSVGRDISISVGDYSSNLQSISNQDSLSLLSSSASESSTTFGLNYINSSSFLLSASPKENSTNLNISQVINLLQIRNEYQTRIRKRCWRLFKAYVLSALLSSTRENINNKKNKEIGTTLREQVVNYVVDLLKSISNIFFEIKNQDDIKCEDNYQIQDFGGINDISQLNNLDQKEKSSNLINKLDEYQNYALDIINVLISYVQLSGYCTRITKIKQTNQVTINVENEYDNSNSLIISDTSSISYLILSAVLQANNGKTNLLKYLWYNNSEFESKLCTLLTECIRQCNYSEVLNCFYYGSINIQKDDNCNIIKSETNTEYLDLKTLSVSLPDLQLYPRSFLITISRELIQYPVSAPDKNQINEYSEGNLDFHNISNTNTNNHNNAGNISQLFSNFPHSPFFIGSYTSSNFHVNIDGRTVICDRATGGGGMVISRAPLTFRGLQTTGLTIPPNILSFRILNIARFGITVAPSNVITMPIDEVFQRNDVVGFKPSGSNSPLLPQNLFALEVSYTEGSVIDIRYGVSTTSSGSILRSEIFVGGESIGSVLEVQFNELAQISEDTRLSVIFLVLDPLTLYYEGLPFTTRYRRRSSTWFELISSNNISNISNNSDNISNLNTDNINNQEINSILGCTNGHSAEFAQQKQKLKDIQMYSYITFLQNIHLYQQILLSDSSILCILKNDLISTMCTRLLKCSNLLKQNLDNFIQISLSGQIIKFRRPDINKNGFNSDQSNEEILDLLIDHCLLSCSICAIFGIDINSNECLDDYNEDITSNNKTNNKQNFQIEKNLLLRRRCSNIIDGDFPWLSSSIDSHVLCYTCLYGLSLKQCEKLLQGFLSILEVNCINAIYKLFGNGCITVNLSGFTEKIDEQDQNPDINKQQYQCLLSVICVLISRSILVISLITRIIIELYPNSNVPLSNLSKDILLKLFCIFGEFSLKSSGDNEGVNLYDLFSGKSVSNIMNNNHNNNNNNILLKQVIECTGIVANSTPNIKINSIIPIEDTKNLWYWIYNLILNNKQSLQDNYYLSPIKHIDDFIYGHLNINQRIFNLDGSNPMTAKKLVLRSHGTIGTWSIQIATVDSLCNICGIIPEFINSKIYETKQNDIHTKKVEENEIDDSQLIKCLHIIRLMRICCYFICRGREDFIFPAAHQNIDDNNHLSPSPEYWLLYRRPLSNDISQNQQIGITNSTINILKRLDSESMLIDKLYSWQKLLYQSEIWTYQNNIEYYDILQTCIMSEILFHLIGSLIQVISIKKNNKINTNEKSLSYSSLSPSVYVAHWLMDPLIRHPLCPSGIRNSIVTPYTWNCLFSLLINGIQMPTKLAIDASRVTYWICSKYKMNNVHNTINRFIQYQSILDSICYCVSSVLSLYECKTVNEIDGTINQSGLAVYKEMILGKSSLRQLSWDYFTSAEDYKPINRQRINATLICHFMACSAHSILDISLQHSLLPLPHILSFFGKYLNYLSIANHSMLSTSDTIIATYREIEKIEKQNKHNLTIFNQNEFFKYKYYKNLLMNKIPPNTLLPWQYIHETLNYIDDNTINLSMEIFENTGYLMENLSSKYFDNKYGDIISLLRINDGIINNNNNNILSGKINISNNMIRYSNRINGLIGFIIQPNNLLYSKSIKNDLYYNIKLLPRVLYGLYDKYFRCILYEYGGMEIYECNNEVLFSILQNIYYNEKIEHHELYSNNIDINKKYNINNYIQCLRVNKCLYYNGLHSSTIKFTINIDTNLINNKIETIDSIFIGGTVFDSKFNFNNEDLNLFYNEYWPKELLIAIRKREALASNKKQNHIFESYIGTILYSLYDDHCFVFGKNDINKCTARIRGNEKEKFLNYSKSKKFIINVVFQNHLIIWEINNIPLIIMGLPPSSSFMLPIIILDRCIHSEDNLSDTLCNIKVSDGIGPFFVPFSQVISKTEMIPILSKNEPLIKWIPSELKHEFNNSNKLEIELIKNKEHLKRNDNRLLDSSIKIVGYVYPKIYSGISLCTSSCNSNELYKSSLLEFWENWILPTNINIEIINNKYISYIKYLNRRLNPDMSITNNNKISNLNRDEINILSDDDNSNSNIHINESKNLIKSTLFNSLDPGKSFTITFQVQSKLINNDKNISLVNVDSKPFGIGIDWINGLYRYIWMCDGSFIVSLLPPLPYEISESYNEYNIPKNTEIKITGKSHNNLNNKFIDLVEIPEYGLGDEITIEFQPSIPALIFFKNSKYCFSFNFTRFYQELNIFGLSTISLQRNYIQDLDCNNSSQILLDTDKWIIRQFFIMALLDDNVEYLYYIMKQYKDIIIDKNGQFQFLISLTNDMCNTLLSFIPLLINNNKHTFRNLLNDTYTTIKFLKPQEYLSKIINNELQFDLNILREKFEIDNISNYSGKNQIIRQENPFWLACWLGLEKSIKFLLLYTNIDVTGCLNKQKSKLNLNQSNISSNCMYIGFYLNKDKMNICINNNESLCLKQTGLMASIISGNARIAYILLCIYNSNVNLKDKEGNTCYHFALAYGHLNIAELLAYKGINPYICNKNGQIAGFTYRRIYSNSINRKEKKIGNYTENIDTDADNNNDNDNNIWYMTPQPSNVGLHNDRDMIVEFTYQYERLYCFGISSIDIEMGNKYTSSLFENNLILDSKRKSNLLPPYQYPWPCLFSNCQLISVIDEKDEKNIKSPLIYTIKIISLNIGGIVQNNSLLVTSNISKNNSTSDNEFTLENENLIHYTDYINSKFSDSFYLNRIKLNIHTIQYLFYRWLKAIKCTSQPLSGNTYTTSTVALSISRREITGRPIDEEIYYYNELENNIQSNHDNHNNSTSSYFISNITSSQSNAGTTVTVADDNSLFRNQINRLSLLTDYNVSGILIKQSIMEEIYNGLSLVKNKYQLLDIIHTIHKYLTQLITINNSLSSYSSTDMNFPRNCGIDLNKDTKSDDNKVYDYMRKICWELLEIEEYIDKDHGYYPYWYSEKERYIWIHQIRKLLSLLCTSTRGSISYSSCRSLIEWIPNLDLLNKSYCNHLIKIKKQKNKDSTENSSNYFNYNFKVKPIISIDLKILSEMHKSCQQNIDNKIIQLLNLELSTHSIYKLILSETYKMIANISTNSSNLFNTMSFTRIDPNKILPKNDSSLWLKCKISPSDSFDIIKLLSVYIKDLIQSVIYKIYINHIPKTSLQDNMDNIDNEKHFPLQMINKLLNKISPIYSTSILIKSDLNSDNKQEMIRTILWYIDILKQFIYGRIILLNRFNDISKYTIPMISAVYNSPIPTYEQEDFLRMSSPRDFFINIYGNNYWKLLLNNKDLEINKHDFLLSSHFILIESTNLLGSWGYYNNINSSPRMVIHVGPYDIPIPISSYLFLKPFYKVKLINSLWNDILKKLVDSGKNNANNASNNGLTVHLNRSLAISDNDLKHTLLAQATRQILYMLPEKLRISERPFLVVFRGEGSTDFGGPFQEFLSWISNEIMNWNNKSKISDNEDKNEHDEYNINNKSRLFIPCANAIHSIGHNQDTVVIEPCNANLIYNNLSNTYKSPKQLYICEEDLLFDKELKNKIYIKYGEGSLLRKLKNEIIYKNICSAKTIENNTNDILSYIKLLIPSLKLSKIGRINNVILRTVDSNINNFNFYIDKTIENGNKDKLKLHNSSRRADNIDLDQIVINSLSYPLSDIQDRIVESEPGIDSTELSRVQGQSNSQSSSSPIAGVVHKLDPWEWPKDKAYEDIMKEIYECLGRVMGICMIIKSALNINLNPLIWKKFVGQPLSLKDLIDADCIAYEILNSLKSINSEMKYNTPTNENDTEKDPQNSKNLLIPPELEGLTFQIENMNGGIISLLSNNNEGESVNVNLKNLHLFIQLAERCRMMEDISSITCILKGLGSILPLGRMRLLFDYSRIEYLICGESYIDLNVLKQHTVCTQSELKEQLFQVLETFTNEQMQELLRFVSGRSRLPQGNDEWKFSVSYDNPDIIQDERLPIATTCGFRLSLPKYSSKKILRERLLYAIHNCVAIDLDAYVVHDNVQSGYDE